MISSIVKLEKLSILCVNKLALSKILTERVLINDCVLVRRSFVERASLRDVKSQFKLLGT